MQITINVKDETNERLRKEAAKEERSLSKMGELLILEALNWRKFFSAHPDPEYVAKFKQAQARELEG